MGIFRSLTGAVRLELTSANVAESLRQINEMDIPITDVQSSGELTVLFTASRRALRSIEIMAQRRGERLRVLERRGLFWQINSLRHRPVLLIGMSFLLALAFFAPSRVLFVEVEGNAQVPSSLILEAAQDAGICFGASRRAVRSEKMKNALLGAVPQLQWAGVNTYGCTAVISVRERETELHTPDEAAVSNIVASCDGVITSCTATSGSVLCGVGQAVEKGQLLISGYVDCGQVITATRAQGEVFAQTRRDLSVVTPSESLVRSGLLAQKTNFSLQIGKKRINFYKGSGISDGTCVKMYSQYQFTLPGGYCLPVALIKETILSYDTQAQPCSEEEAAKLLTNFAKDYLRQQMVALTILDAQEEFLFDGGRFQLTGQYACNEMIGREQGEQIGDFHGKTD